MEKKTRNKENIKEITSEMLYSRIDTLNLEKDSGIPSEYLIMENEEFKQLIECPIK